ncbi:MAG TPA: hypothetical protein VGP26_31175 [Actinophytocola sp.]|nr:hypothetical protein [Actinophytocola sp.]
MYESGGYESGRYESVDDLAGVVTSVLSPDGPLGSLSRTLTNALDGVWAEFFAAPTPPGSTNWNAYTHQQLYDMLWQDADVGDVGTVAAEWGRHSSALTEFADVLRGQGTEMRSNWQGRAADLATDRLAELSDRIWNSGARAATVQKAAGDAGDALAVARNTMPPPPADPMTLASSAVGAGPIPPLEAILVGGARVFTADAVSGAAKAEAVRVMQRYEASLRNSSHQVVPSQPDATTSRNYKVDGPEGTTSAAAVSGGLPLGGTGGAPWSRLVGGAQPGPGGLTGAGPGAVPSVLAAESAALSDAAAKRAMGAGGYMSPMAALGHGADDEERRHRRNLPNVDNGLFKLDQRSSAPVIGGVTDREHDIER